MQTSFTVKEVIKLTVNQLGRIAVPRYLNKQIGIPIDQAIDNLNACIEAWDSLEKNSSESEPDTDQAGEKEPENE